MKFVTPVAAFCFFSGFKQAPLFVLKRLTDVKDGDHLAWGTLDFSMDTEPPNAAAYMIRGDILPMSRGRAPSSLSAGFGSA